MTVTKGTYADVETQVYSYVINTLKYNSAIACGILANVEAESGFNPGAIGDSGDAYGLFQWNSRRESLFSFTGSNTPSVTQQLNFMKYELENKESKARKKIEDLPNTAQGAYEAADLFCRYYERPSNSTDKGKYRGGLARDKYWTYYGEGKTPTNTVLNIGQKIVQIAKDNLNKDYEDGADGPNYFDSPGLVYYCYTEAGVSISKNTAIGYYKEYKKTAKSVKKKDVSAGDLLFYKLDRDTYDIAIADGNGGRIIVKEDSGVVEEDNLGDPDHILRILSDSETSQGYVPASSESAEENLSSIEYAFLTANDPYSRYASMMLSNVQARGYDYGYLIDMTHGGVFKFYIPEFSEQAGSNWNPIDISGRSVTVQSYKSTNSRSINIALELYAGVGVYTALSGESGEEAISRMHKDANFVKSLEYPDYSNAIVRPPSTVQLILGPVINIVGVVSNVVVEHLKPYDEHYRSMYIKLSFTVTQIAKNPPDYSDIRKGQYTINSNSSSVSEVISLINSVFKD